MMPEPDWSNLFRRSSLADSDYPIRKQRCQGALKSREGCRPRLVWRSSISNKRAFRGSNNQTLQWYRRRDNLRGMEKRQHIPSHNGTATLLPLCVQHLYSSLSVVLRAAHPDPLPCFAYIRKNLIQLLVRNLVPFLEVCQAWMVQLAPLALVA